MLREGRPLAGAFNAPAVAETYWAWQGGGAYLNGQRVWVNDPGEMRSTDLISISSTTIERYHLQFAAKMRCLGSAAMDLASVAAGHFVAAIHDNWHLHDLAASLCMCYEAGAVVTDEQGRPFDTYAGLDRRAPGPCLVVAGPRLHPQVLATVKGENPA